MESNSYFLYPKQVQAIFGIKHSTLAQWRSRGLGPDFFKMEGTILYSRAELDKFFEAHRVQCHVPRFAKWR